MTAPEVRRRRLPVAELYVLLCTGLAVLMAIGAAGPLEGAILLLLMLPAAIVPFALLLTVLFVTEGLLSGWAGQVSFVVFVAVLAVLQAWMFRTMARNWRRADVEIRPTRLTAGADTGL